MTQNLDPRPEAQDAAAPDQSPAAAMHARPGQKILILHIGMGKTGTTALQEFFWRNRRRLAAEGIAYPSTGIMSAAHHLISPHIPAFLHGSGWDFLEPEAWLDKVQALPQPVILMSSELIAWADAEKVARFCEAVSARVDLRICVYLRRQDNIIMAGYNQQIKAGTQVARIEHVLARQIDRFDYEDKLDRWARCVGDDRMIVLPYERGQFYRRDLIADFSARVLGLADVSGWDFGPPENANPRLTPEAMEFKRLVNAVLPEPARSEAYNRPLIDALAGADAAKGIFHDQNTLSPAQRHEVMAHFHEGNARIARRYMGRDDGVIFHDPLPARDAPSEKSDQSGEISDEALVHLMRHLQTHEAALASQLEAVASAPADDNAAPERAALLGAACERLVALANAARAAGPLDTPKPAPEVPDSGFFGQDCAPAPHVGATGSEADTSLPQTSVAIIGRPLIARVGPRRAIIHAGFPKTGTTAIQQAFWKKRADLLHEHGVLYPGLDENHTRPLIAMFRNAPEVNARLESLKPHELMRERRRSIMAFDADLAVAGWRELVISGEGLQTFRADDWDRLLGWLMPHVSRIDVVFGLRDPVSFGASALQQQLKQGFTLAQCAAQPSFADMDHRVFHARDALRRNGAVGDIMLWNMDRAVRAPRGMVADFAASIGLPARVGEVLARVPTHRNERLSAPAVRALDARNRETIPRRPVTRDELEALLAIKGPRFSLDPQDAAAEYERLARAYQALRAAFPEADLPRMRPA